MSGREWKRRNVYTMIVRPVLMRPDPETVHNLVMRFMIMLSWAIGMVEEICYLICYLWTVVKRRRRP